MNIDFSGILALISSINPAAAAIVAAVIFIVQHLAAKKGANLTLAGLLGALAPLFGPKTPAAPTPDKLSTPDAAPVGPSDDPLAGKPARKFLRDLALKLFHEKLSSVLLSAKDDDEAAMKVFNAFKVKEVKADDPTTK